MRAVYFNEGEVELREIQELPDKGKKVHVRSIGICGSDLHMLEMKVPINCVVGHEIAGVLDDGTPVAVEPVVVGLAEVLHAPAREGLHPSEARPAHRS